MDKLAIFLLLGVLFIIQTEGQNTAAFRIITTDLKALLLNPIFGNTSCTVTPQLPAPAPGCNWKFPLSGTRGQTSTIFYQNQTNFFTGQVVCEDGIIARTTVFQLWGPYSYCTDGAYARAFPLYDLDPTIPLSDINMNWDHTCNLVVLQPQYYSNGTLITTKQVSEYDAQVRPQVDYEFNPKDCDDCWRKVNGFSALDFGSWNSIWSPELNCGVSCILYTSEEHLVKGEVKPPRALIGRSFRTDILAINVTDSVNTQTLSWNPFSVSTTHQNQFLGIGVCCTEKWCHPDCMNLDSHLVLISFLPYNKDQELSILADIGDIIDPDTIRLGVEFYYTYSTDNNNRKAFVFYQQSIIAFDIVLQNGLIVSAKKSSQSPKVDLEIVSWSSGF